MAKSCTGIGVGNTLSEAMDSAVANAVAAGSLIGEIQISPPKKAYVNHQKEYMVELKVKEI